MPVRHPDVEGPGPLLVRKGHLQDFDLIQVEHRAPFSPRAS